MRQLTLSNARARVFAVCGVLFRRIDLGGAKKSFSERLDIDSESDFLSFHHLNIHIHQGTSKIWTSDFRLDIFRSMRGGSGR